MRIRVFCTVLFVLMNSGLLCAGEYRDVRDMGDIWIVTIDKSGSMLTGTGAVSLANNVYRRLMDGECLSTADFSKDRFIFFTSGYSYSPAIGLGNELRASKPFDQSFIHSTDDKVYSFNTREDCAAHIRKLLAANDYGHQLSFVSQIRVFSVVRAVNTLKERGETSSFEGFKLLTITDDADQNDQWMMDFRNLKKWAPNKVKEVSDSTSKYVYNSLNGRGDGNLDEIFGDEKNTPHLWVYQYRSREQFVPENHSELLSLKLSDGETITARKKTGQIDGDNICFFRIDSIRVNKKMIIVGDCFGKKCSWRYDHDNTLKTNKVTVWGSAQVEYEDGIFGPHYKTVPFMQQEVVLSDRLSSFLSAVVAAVASALAILLLYLLMIRPRLVLFTIDSSIGRRTVIRRGFASSWKGESIPIQCYQSESRGRLGVVVKRHRCIVSFNTDTVDRRSGEVMITSYLPLDLSVDVISHCTSEDIEGIYDSRTADYSPLLRAAYEKTVFFKLYRRSLTATKRWQRRLIRFEIGCLNIIGKRHYYLVRDIREHPRVIVSQDRFLYGKRFVIEYFKKGKSSCADLQDRVAQSALTYYYEKENPVYDVILCAYREEESVFWTVLQLNDYLVSRDSLRAVKGVIFYEQKEGDRNTSALKEVAIGLLKKDFPHCRIGFIQLPELTNEKDSFSFDIRRSTAPGYIFFMETSESPKVQAMYSPVRDADTKEKFVKLRRGLKSGYLYLSLVPVRSRFVSSSLYRRLSQTVVKSDDKHSSLLRLMEGGFEFRDITGKY